MKEQIYTFKGMPGVRAKQLRGPMKSSLTGFLAALRKYRVCSDAGDHGAVLVYRDDDGTYRCSLQAWCVTKAEGTFKTKREVAAWLKRWLPAQRNREAA
jgi:hypothetical protein